MFSFARRKSVMNVAPVVRRITDLTSPNLAPPDGDARSESRYNRSLPALLAPWEKDAVIAGECTWTLSKNLSDRGVALLLQQPFRAAAVVVGFWPPSAYCPAEHFGPFFILGEVRENVEIGGGYWQLGIAFTQLLNDQLQVRELMPLAARLLPPRVLAPTLVGEALARQPVGR
jgi:hypothetical protein